ncbi:MAG: division/cell wall cluster transcriptional repressor MraZ [Treponema sp.]|jgi:MraZ protein|nr:division/cell wall cluster transcriptional repressor MraZ [Treponema sp.]
MELKTGSAESTLDDKGRVSIPVRFREYYQGDLVITRGMEKCAWIMTAEVWERYESDLRKRSKEEKLNDEEWNILEYKIIGHAQEAELDKAGRIAIPPTLRKYANLSKDCMVINGKNRLSIWDAHTFESYLDEKDTIARAAMNKLGAQDIFRGE